MNKAPTMTPAFVIVALWAGQFAAAFVGLKTGSGALALVSYGFAAAWISLAVVTLTRLAKR